MPLGGIVPLTILAFPILESMQGTSEPLVDKDTGLLGSDTWGSDSLSPIKMFHNWVIHAQ